MEIAEFEITQYKNSIQSGLGFSVTLPDILRIQHEPPVPFQERLLALIYNGTSIHYENIRTRIEYMMNTFIDLYSPAYFKGVNLRHQYSIDVSFLRNLDIDLNLCVPTYIFPEVSTPFSENLYALSKVSRFTYNGVEIIANYDFFPIETNNRELYSVSIGCLYEQDIGDINVILTKFDELKQTAWNVLHSSITDYLREAMAEVN